MWVFGARDPQIAAISVRLGDFLSASATFKVAPESAKNRSRTSTPELRRPHKHTFPIHPSPLAATIADRREASFSFYAAEVMGCSWNRSIGAL